MAEHRIRTLNDLDALAEKGRQTRNPGQHHLRIGMATCGTATGAGRTRYALEDLVEARDLGWEVSATGCIGFCQREPIVEWIRPDGGSVFFQRLTADKAEELVDALVEGDPPRRMVLGTAGLPDGSNLEALPVLEELPFYRAQGKVALRNCGHIDPESLAEYASKSGYRAAFRAVTEMDPGAVINVILDSGLRGRGGAGFPTGRKWALARGSADPERIIICNADEGDPGAYMDRSILEGDPHSVIEGMIIGAWAMGASLGIVYVRDEYPQAIRMLDKAIREARAAGILGRAVFGSDFHFNLKIVRGGGAFVCGEETSLIASLMGLPGEPRQRPPFPAESGLWGRPTNINNVETFANVAPILEQGAQWYQGIGTDTSPGTKVFSLVGKINNTGLVEVPMGLPLRDIIETLGGGILRGRPFKAVQTGGPSGGCIPKDLLDLPVDYERLAETGAIMGSGGMIVMDDTTCMVDLARYFLDFLKEESCGKCTPCREGIDNMLRILEGLCRGEGREGDVEDLEALGAMVQDFSLCGLGQTAPNPVLSTIRYFRDEYEAHIREGFCPAGTCMHLFRFRIDADKCNGCGLCRKVCPADAVSGEKKEIHTIDEEACVLCGACREACRRDAVQVAPRVEARARAALE